MKKIISFLFLAILFFSCHQDEAWNKALSSLEKEKEEISRVDSLASLALTQVQALDSNQQRLDSLFWSLHQENQKLRKELGQIKKDLANFATINDLRSVIRTYDQLQTVKIQEAVKKAPKDSVVHEKEIIKKQIIFN